MIQIQDTTRTLPFFRPVPLTGLPLLYNPEHLFPYTSYGDTMPAPVPRTFRMVVLENELLRSRIQQRQWHTWKRDRCRIP